MLCGNFTNQLFLGEFVKFLFFILIISILQYCLDFNRVKLENIMASSESFCQDVRDETTLGCAFV